MTTTPEVFDAMMPAQSASLAYELPAEQQVRYTYWPVNYYLGDPTVLSAASLPLSGVRFSEQAKGVGELRASLQLADPEVRAMYPWDKIVPRQTGIVVVRTVYDPVADIDLHRAVWHGTVWAAPASPATGRMEITARTVEYAWAQRLITGPVGGGDLVFAQADRTDIAAALLDPNQFSQLGLGAGDHPGWITVDPPTQPTGKLHDFTYLRNQQTNLLEAHQDRSKVGDGYEWFTSVRVLDGPDAYNATSYRLQFVMGYPRLGREYGVNDIPRFSYFTDGRGNVLTSDPVYDGSAVRNVMWGNGSGYQEATVRALATNSADITNGFLMTEGRYSNPDVNQQDTLEAYTIGELIQSYASERFVKSVTVRGDHPPYFGSYGLYDDALFTTDDWTNPDRPDGTRDVTYFTRIMGWTVTPPEGERSETVQLMLAGGMSGVDDG